MITMSALPRLMACPGSAVLPRAEVASIYADLGNNEHAELASLDDLPPELAALVPPGARSEVKIAYDVSDRTARILGEGAGRSYGELRPFEIPGSIDVLGVETDVAIVIDWKTGFLDVESAATNPQLWGYGLAATRALGLQRAILRVVYTKTGRVDEYEADALELAAFADRLERLHLGTAALAPRHARGERIPTVEGAWCRHCAAKPYCPSKVALLRQVAERGLAVIGDTDLTPTSAAAAYHELRRVDQLVKDAKGRLRSYIETVGPIDLGDGRMYGRFARPGDKKLDADKTAQAIADVVGSDSAPRFLELAFERKATQAAIGRAARAVQPKGHTVLARKVVERVDELGGVRRGDEYPIGEFTVSAHRPATLPELDIAEIDRLIGEVT